MTVKEVPFERSYWIADRFLCGPTPFAPDNEMTSERIEALLKVGVSVVVSLIAREELGHFPEIADMFEPWLFGSEHPQLQRQHIFIWRDGATPAPERAAIMLDVIDYALDHGEIVYTHCWGGRGRTGALAGCWLARHGYAQGDATLAHLATIRLLYGALKPAPETPAQRRLVRCWRPGE